MADIITLSVKAVGATEALATLQKLQTVTKSLNSTAVNIKVNTSGADTKALNTLNSLKNAEGELTNARDKTAQATQRAESAQRQYTSAQEQAAKVQRNVTRETGNGTDAVKKQEQSLTSMIGKFTQWYLIGGIVSGVSNAFREALSTMKAVDDELVTVRKVTDATGAELERLEKQAYETASAYGESADAYLSSVSEFARAGYGDNAAALAELSTKTQIVGDVIAETANQFLLSVDAAYKYNGEISKLTAVLDGANEIDNKYATSIEAIAEGLGIVAPVAAQAHVGIDELTAAIGTITAVTQRSGSEAARAFRALVLNIVGDTKTEIDEGVTWTTGEIAGLRDVIKTYASDAYEAAEATGSVINPMEAIAGLAQSMEDGLLTEQKLMEMVSDIGGKLRTSQLLALIQNWDMYESMLEDFGGAVGSADAEVANALDSWTRKAQVLSNTWTQLVSNFVETDYIKGGLDVMTGALDALDSGFGHAAISAGLFTAAVALLSKGATAAAGAMGVLNGTMLKSPLFYVAAGSLAIFSIVEAIDALTTSDAELQEQLEATNSELEQLTGAGSEYDQLISKGEELTDIERRRLAVLEAQADEIRNQQRLLQEEEFNRREGREKVSYRETGFNMTEDAYAVMSHGGTLRSLESKYNTGAISLDEYKSGISGMVADETEYVEQLKEWRDLGFELTEEEEARIAQYEEMVDILTALSDAQEEETNATEDAADAAEEANAQFSELMTTLDDLAGRLDVAQEALEDFSDDGELSYSTISDINEKFGELSNIDEYINRLSDADLTADELNRILGEMTLELIKQKIAAGDLTAENENLVIKMLEEAGVVNAAAVAQSLLASATNASTNEINEFNSTTIDTSADIAQVRSLTGELITLGNTLQAVEALKRMGVADPNSLIIDSDVLPEFEIPDIEVGGGGGTVTDPELERHESLVTFLKSELDLLQKQGAPVEEQIAKQKEIQAALHEQAEYMRSIGSEQTEINALSSEWWDIQKAILELQNDLWDELEEAVDKRLDEAADLRDDEIEAIDAAINKLKAENEEAEKLNDLEEQRLAVLEAQQDLLDAQEQRTVRIYNAEKDQWDWVANPQDVASAEEALEEAQKEYDEALKEYALDAEIAAMEERKDAIQSAYESFEEEWEDIKESIEEPGRDISEILEDIAENGAPAMKAAVDNVAAMLGGLANYEKATAASSTGDSYSGGGGTASRDYANDTTDYSALMLGAQSEDEFKYWETQRNNKAEAQGIDIKGEGWRDNDELYEEWSSSRKYDSGGVLKGLGGIKATTQDEMVLPPKLTQAMLSPSSNAVFQERVAQLGYLFGTNHDTPIPAPASAGGGVVNNNTGANYYFNGVQIGAQEAESLTVAQLARRMRVLSLHSSNY